ncbi:MAG: adenosine-specific kinase [Spirochaetia bacterium]|jgi:adenosine/AMP kinase|nr:adenosine-specific kinase [Spirochaetia bacterium]
MNIGLNVVQVKIPEGANLILGQSHFIKTVEDIAEIVISSVPGVEYGLAFCEASGPVLVRTEGNSEELIKASSDNALAIGAGHSFVLLIKKAFPINILNQIKNCQEVASIYAATANPLQVITAETGQGKGILGVIDGSSPAEAETADDKKARKEMLRKFGYKF